MSTQNEDVHLSQEIKNFYVAQLTSHGDSAQGVGWKNDIAQEIRFSQLAKVFSIDEGFSINDLGCGTGRFYSFLIKKGFNPSRYYGYDILEEMVQASMQRLPINTEIEIAKINSAADMKMADYSIASGIFNVKYDAKESAWLHYVLSVIEQMDAKSKLGFSFNLLTKYSDKEFMQSYLYYADPMFLFDFCKRNFSKNVALLHDYDQYDFTIIVRK